KNGKHSEHIKNGKHSEHIKNGKHSEHIKNGKHSEHIKNDKHSEHIKNDKHRKTSKNDKHNKTSKNGIGCNDYDKSRGCTTSPYKNSQTNSDNCFYFTDKIKLQKAYSYIIGKLFEESLIDTFTGSKFDYLHFDDNIKDFLKSCLEEDINKREPLESLFNHPCFSDCFDLYINIYDDNINTYKNDKEKAVQLKDINYINNLDYNIFNIPSDNSSTPNELSDSLNFNCSSQYSSSSS
ncbi:hypothetical protein HEP_00283600, partial [Hepatocystis sp. ex Piliocolobus tephrosceles]